MAAPYSKKFGSWLQALEDRIAAAGVGRAVRGALLTWTAREARAGFSQDWTPQQLAKAGKCDATTVRLAIPQLQTAGLLDQVEAPNFGARKAGRYQLKGLDAWAFSSSSRREKSPSPGSSLRSEPKPPVSTCKAPAPAPVPGGAWGSVFGNIAQELATFGPVDSQRLEGVAKKSPWRGAEALRILTAARTALAWRKGRAGYRPVRDPLGWVLGALGDTGMGEDVLLQAKRARRLGRLIDPAAPSDDGGIWAAVTAWKNADLDSPAWNDLRERAIAAMEAHAPDVLQRFRAEAEQAAQGYEGLTARLIAKNRLKDLIFSLNERN